MPPTAKPAPSPASDRRDQRVGRCPCALLEKGNTTSLEKARSDLAASWQNSSIESLSAGPSKERLSGALDGMRSERCRKT
ncbi:hypothetical protein [Paeniglutamicibacter sp. NPDC091659]|uniref:hypothetical protein n=1 Tax=Paeniglutamicibacter sp. NPDC091659 TaxID=3364389 RepID=UPI00382A94E8